MNKQILTDIVNSILGLSKKKKKEFIELLDNGINGVSEQLNETVEEVNRKINNIEPSDFEENDETKSSFIKNRPFYDYNEFNGIEYDTHISETSVHFFNGYNKTISDEHILLDYISDDDIRVGYSSLIDETQNIREATMLDCRYKSDKNNPVIRYGEVLYPVVNYYNGIQLRWEELTTDKQNNTGVFVADNLLVFAYFEEGDLTKIRFNNNLEAYQYNNKLYLIYYIEETINGKKYFTRYTNDSTTFESLRAIRYYKNLYNNYFKSLDEKYIPDSIKNRITALEQAVVALGGTLNT